ncbi:MAG TPA: hypothetical protein VFU21_20675 [Kofleriaceae bacterium]|nr:hypothetical protein [Kofleriaceae bacterium]
MTSAAALLRTSAAGLCMTAAALASRAEASPESEVASAFDKGDKLDLHVRVEYRFTTHRAAIKRELSGLPGADPAGPVPLVKDLVVRRARHEIVPRLELGVFTDLAVTAALPVVLRDSRRLDLDQREGDDCVFPDDPGMASCIDRSNSTTIRDAILPAEGFDAGGGTLDPDGATIFRGVNRSGLDQLHLGLVWAPMNQERDATKPTWKIGAELRLAVGRTMQLDREDPGRSDGVSRGIHEVRLFTTMARRLAWAEPFFEIYWQGAVAARDGAPLDDPSPAFGAQQTGPQQLAGGRFGFEAIAWESDSGAERVGILLAGRLEGHFEGRDYTDLWEVLAYAGDASAGGPLALDADPVADGSQTISHPGVTNVENYLTLGGQAGVAAHLGERIRFDLSFALDWDQSHLLTFADAGTDSDDDGDTVDPGTAEVNPLHAPLVDTTGRRYRVDETFDVVFLTGFRLLL